jgi:hypothetical protein
LSPSSPNTANPGRKGFCESGEGDGGHFDADRLGGGKDSAKVIVDNVDGGEVRVGRDNRMEQSVDSGESFISSYSSASVHSLPCGPRMAEEKESGFPAPSRFKSAVREVHRGEGGGGRGRGEERLQAGAAAALW